MSVTPPSMACHFRMLCVTICHWASEEEEVVLQKAG